LFCFYGVFIEMISLFPFVISGWVSCFYCCFRQFIRFGLLQHRFRRTCARRQLFVQCVGSNGIRSILIHSDPCGPILVKFWSSSDHFGLINFRNQAQGFALFFSFINMRKNCCSEHCIQVNSLNSAAPSLNPPPGWQVGPPALRRTQSRLALPSAVFQTAPQSSRNM
jgi:hypothetical protein